MSDDWTGWFSLEANEPPLPGPAMEDMGELYLPHESPRSKVYAWGYEPPQTTFLQKQFQESLEAQAFAAERGWEES